MNTVEQTSTYGARRRPGSRLSRSASRPEAPAFLRGSLFSGIRRVDVKNLAQLTPLMNGLDDIMRSARLWAKLYARRVLDTCGVVRSLAWPSQKNIL